MCWQRLTKPETIVALLSAAVGTIPNRVPGKARFGRTLLRPFLSISPAVLGDRGGCCYILPSYAEPIAEHIFTFGAYEPDTQRVILEFLPERGALIDVGASIGALAIPVAKARPDASIVCVEADPDIHALLKQNANRNDCERIRTMSCIVGAVDNQLVPFYRAPSEKFGMGSLGPQFDAVPLMLRQRSIDALLKELDIDRVDVIKIDVEGAEFGVLRGAQQLLRSERPPVVIFEFADWAEARLPGQQPGDAQCALFSSGYRLFHLQAGGRLGTELVAPLRSGFSMIIALPSHVSLPSRLSDC
jgi:FkbM family methyltransferase